MKDIDAFEKIWIEFCNKMRQGKLCEDDFVDETREKVEIAYTTFLLTVEFTVGRYFIHSDAHRRRV